MIMNILKNLIHPYQNNCRMTLGSFLIRDTDETEKNTVYCLQTTYRIVESKKSISSVEYELMPLWLSQNQQFVFFASLWKDQSNGYFKIWMQFSMDMS